MASAPSRKLRSFREVLERGNHVGVGIEETIPPIGREGVRRGTQTTDGRKVVQRAIAGGSTEIRNQLEERC